ISIEVYTIYYFTQSISSYLIINLFIFCKESQYILQVFATLKKIKFTQPLLQETTLGIINEYCKFFNGNQEIIEMSLTFILSNMTSSQSNNKSYIAISALHKLCQNCPSALIPQVAH